MQWTVSALRFVYTDTLPLMSYMATETLYKEGAGHMVRVRAILRSAKPLGTHLSSLFFIL